MSDDLSDCDAKACLDSESDFLDVKFQCDLLSGNSIKWHFSNHMLKCLLLFFDSQYITGYRNDPRKAKNGNQGVRYRCFESFT